MLHLLMVGRQRHSHRVDAVFQHIQFAEHKAFDAAVELAPADTVNGINHVADRAGHIAHQAPAENQRNTDTKQHHHRGDKNFPVLLQPHGLEIQLQRHISQHVVIGLGIRFGRFIL